MKTETRGRKPKKAFKIGIGELKEIKTEELTNFRYRARSEGWSIETRKVGGKILAFRKA